MRNVWANAQPVVSDDEMAAIRSRNVVDVQQLARVQIDRAKDLYSEATGLKWYQGLLPAYLQYKKYRDVIDNAEMNFANAEREPDESRKKELFILAWRAARIAVNSIAEEAKLNPTAWHAIARPAIDAVKDTVADAKKSYDTAKDTLSAANNALLYGAVIAAAYFLMSDRGKG